MISETITKTTGPYPSEISTSKLQNCSQQFKGGDYLPVSDPHEATSWNTVSRFRPPIQGRRGGAQQKEKKQHSKGSSDWN